MNKLLLILLFSINSFAQIPKFILTPNGLVNQIDSTSNYLVLEFPETKKENLYNKSISYMHAVYASPKDVISELENESITVNAINRNSIRRNSMHIFDINYTIKIDFKDNKLRINAPSFSLTTFTDKRQQLYIVSGNSIDGSNLGIYNKSGKLKSDKAKSDLENFFNQFVWGLYGALIEDDKDDW